MFRERERSGASATAYEYQLRRRADDSDTTTISSSLSAASVLTLNFVRSPSISTTTTSADGWSDAATIGSVDKSVGAWALRAIKASTHTTSQLYDRSGSPHVSPIRVAEDLDADRVITIPSSTSLDMDAQVMTIPRSVTFDMDNNLSWDMSNFVDPENMFPPYQRILEEQTDSITNAAR